MTTAAVARSVIAASWLVLIAVWAFAARSAKPSVGGSWRWRRALGLRLLVLAGVVLVIRATSGPHRWHGLLLHGVPSSPPAVAIGAALCVIGVGLAIWARAALGRNWGMPMSRKTEPELVTKGPYAFVRHPIYTGIILALVGSTIGASVVWGIPLLFTGGYFVYALRREERLLRAQFPERYPAYMKRTKALLPFVW